MNEYHKLSPFGDSQFKLRPLNFNDVDRLYEIMSSKGAMQFFGNHHIIKEDTYRLIEYCASAFDSRLEVLLGIQEYDTLVGYVSLRYETNSHPFNIGELVGFSLSIIIDKEWWGKGIAKKALNLFFNFLIKEVDFKGYAFAAIKKGNLPSIKLFKRFILIKELETDEKLIFLLKIGDQIKNENMNWQK